MTPTTPWRRGEDGGIYCEICGELIGSYSDLEGGGEIPGLWERHAICVKEAHRFWLQQRAELGTLGDADDIEPEPEPE